MNTTLIVGLTGGIGSGKSSISKYLIDKGIPVFDADFCSKQILQPGQVAFDDVVKVFGENILLGNGCIDRKKLADIVFKDDKQLKILEDIQYKRIWQQFQEFIKYFKAKQERLIVLDAPLLIESGWWQYMNAVWLVHITESEQIKRVSERDKLDITQIKQRIRAQLPFVEKQKFATDIIDNSGTLSATFKQVEMLLTKYKK